MVVVLAEPAVYVLTEQIEDVTAGHIKRRVIMVVLSIGIACAVSLSMIRILSSKLELWHLLLPGFALAAVLSYRVPPIFVGIAYDSGGVASGPMTATFVLAFAQGAAHVIPGADVMSEGFGVIAMVAMVPLVALQILGVVFRRKEEKQQALLMEEALVQENPEGVE
jgi:ABC-type transport system involved in cytochrome c biogenesis permease subunit